VPKSLESCKRKARQWRPRNLHIFFAILNDGRCDIEGVGVFDDSSYRTHDELRFELSLLAGWLLFWQKQATLPPPCKLTPSMARWLWAGQWNDNGRRRGSQADKLLNHVGLAPRGDEHEVAAVVRNATATMMHALIVEFFEARNMLACLCVARCVRADCQVTGEYARPAGGKWFFAGDDRQIYCSPACASTARSRRSRSPYRPSSTA
jgi:hypothetical protein